MEVVVAPAHPLTGDYRALDADRRGHHRVFAELLEADPRLRGRVLDVGCGADHPEVPALRRVLEACTRHDGVDPDPGVADHPGLATRWCACFEDADVPAGVYDAVFTYNVVEHVERPRAFLDRAHRALAPGGVLYALTPHALHPFPALSRVIQAVGLKGRWGARSERKVNEYPAWYRLNRLGSVRRAAAAAGFARAEFVYVPSLQWDRYFPRPLRWIPHAYDRLLGARVPRAAALLVFRLEKG